MSDEPQANMEELRAQYRSSPEWAVVSLLKRVTELERKVVELSKPRKRGRPRKET